MSSLTTSRIVKAALALILISAGGFLMYRGLHEYFGAKQAQKQAAVRWAKQAPPSPSPAGEAAGEAAVMRPIAEGAVFSRLEIPRLDQSLYVVEGDNAAALRRGPGHVRGSAMPGQRGNCVIAGHRDLHFRFLKDVRPGDQVFLETSAGRYNYRVTGSEVISPSQTDVLQPTRDAELHLITCYPFYFIGHAPKRYVVTAELVSQPGAARAPMVLTHAEAAPRPIVLVARPRSRRASRGPSASEVEAERRRERAAAATRALNRAAAAGL